MQLVPAKHFVLGRSIAGTCLRMIQNCKATTLNKIPHRTIRQSLESKVRQHLARTGAINVLDNHEIGFVTISWPIDLIEDFELRIVLNAAMFSLVTRACFKGARDDSDVPFDLYKSTVENTGIMQKAGIRFYSPDQKLDRVC